MAIRIDDPIWKYRGQLYCHMMSDNPNLEENLAELHAFAARLGLKRAWFQDKPRFPHYDLSPSKRALAVRLGAQEMSTKEFVMTSPFYAFKMEGNSEG